MKIVILGAGGRLGAALLREYREKHDIAGFNHAQLDLASLGDVRAKHSDAMNFDVLINAAAFTNVDACETERERAFLINAEAPGVLARDLQCKRGEIDPFQYGLRFRWGETRALHRRGSSESDQPLWPIKTGRRKECACS